MTKSMAHKCAINNDHQLVLPTVILPCVLIPAVDQKTICYKHLKDCVTESTRHINYAPLYPLCYVRLPIRELQQIDCPVCKQVHVWPSAGFPANKAIEQQMYEHSQPQQHQQHSHHQHQHHHHAQSNKEQHNKVSNTNKEQYQQLQGSLFSETRPQSTTAVSKSVSSNSTSTTTSTSRPSSPQQQQQTITKSTEIVSTTVTSNKPPARQQQFVDELWYMGLDPPPRSRN